MPKSKAISVGVTGVFLTYLLRTNLEVDLHASLALLVEQSLC